MYKRVFDIEGPITRKSGDIELFYVLDFLKMLWNGEIF